MSKGAKFRERFDGLAVVRQRVTPSEVRGSMPESLWSSSGGLGLVALLERRSGMEFVDSMVADVMSEGLDRDDANLIVETVLGRPSLAARSRISSGSGSRYLFGVAIDPPVQGSASFVLASVDIDQSVKPPHVVGHEVSVFPLDLDRESEACEVLKILEYHQEMLGLPRVSDRPDGEPAKLLWIGDPAHGGYRPVPHDWEQKVRGLAIAVGLDVEIVSSPSELRAKSLMEGADLVLIVNGIEMNRWSDVVDLGGSEIVGSPGTPFDELLDAARSAVVRACNRAARAADGFEPRSLGKGERVYHRKIGSGGNADVFDEGRTDPCPHGASGFKKFSKAPKALKGMQRRYLNVTDQSLYHCGKYPNCGMYMVEGVA